MRNLGRLQGLPRRWGAMLTWEMAKAGSGASRWGELVLATERAEESNPGFRGPLRTLHDREFTGRRGRATSRHPISVAKDSAYLRRAATMSPQQPALGARAKVGAQL